MSAIAPALSKQHKPGIEIDTYCSPDFICKLQELAKRIPQLKRSGDNFSLWERQLKVMLRNLTGSSDYFQQELHKHDRNLNQAIFSLIFWSIHEELQQDFIINGSAGDAFQFLANRFQSRSSATCIINCANFPEEILDNIVNMVHDQSLEEHECIKERKLEQIKVRGSTRGVPCKVYLGHDGPPVLTTFQALATVNRKFHRLCRPKLWQKITFPTSLPAPMSLWTDDILLQHANFVKSAEFKIEDINIPPSVIRLSASEMSRFDNTLSLTHEKASYGIGLLNIVKIFKACPSLESVYVYLPSRESSPECFVDPTVRLKSPFQLLPKLQHLKLEDKGFRALSGDFILDIIKNLPSLVSLELAGFHFLEKESVKGSLGWNLAQLQKLRKLSLRYIVCEDQTWTLKSWPKLLTNLDLHHCSALTLYMARKLLSGNTPFLTQLQIGLEELEGTSDVEVCFDLPVLKSLGIHEDDGLDLLERFENCKCMEVLEYHGNIFGDGWDSMKNHLSRRTWPKLSVLDIRCSSIYLNQQRLPEEELKEILERFNIKILIKKDSNT